MADYKIFTTLTDGGPYITKIILELPCTVSENDVDISTFNVYAECRDEDTGEILSKKNRQTGRDEILKGYPKVKVCYPSDEKGNKTYTGTNVTLELEEEYLNKRIIGDVLSSKWLVNYYRITQLKNLPGNPPTNGMVFDNCIGEICPQLEGWANSESTYENLKLRYGYYTPPKIDGKAPLVIWLHGAGEGGNDTKIAYTGNKVTALSSDNIQRKLGGAAWLLVPQCPTVWMDDGKEKLGRSNESIYVKPLKYCIEEFISLHENDIDKERIYIGGLSNGGFMTIRMLKDYPDFFAGAIPTCEPFYEENITDTMLENLKEIPIWFVHAKGDELVPPYETSIPLYWKLKKAGADNVHFTLFERVEDLSGKYKNEDGSPKRYFSHGVWIHVYNNDCYTDIDGTKVLVQGVPVTLWEWLGKQKLPKNKKEN
jgi:predicted esterase